MLSCTVKHYTIFNSNLISTFSFLYFHNFAFKPNSSNKLQFIFNLNSPRHIHRHFHNALLN